MTDETLRYYIALQPKFRKVMGTLRESDRIALSDGNIGFIKQIKDGEYVYAQWEQYARGGHGGSCDKMTWADEYFIRLPHLIDRDNPERGLWGMLSTNWEITRPIGGEWIRIRSLDGVEISGLAELALLKALAHQEGIEVK